MGKTRLAKPASVRADPWRSKKWDEITRGRDFSRSDVPTITLLVQWYQVVERCMEDISVDGGVRVAYENKMGDIKALPEIATMKQASAEIRALNRQLGIDDGHEEGVGQGNAGDSYLRVIQGRRSSRRAAPG